MVCLLLKPILTVTQIIDQPTRRPREEGRIYNTTDSKVLNIEAFHSLGVGSVILIIYSLRSMSADMIIHPIQ